MPASYFNPQVELDSMNINYEVQDVPGWDGNFKLVLKDTINLTGGNTLRVVGKVVFTVPDTGDKFYAHFDITYVPVTTTPDPTPQGVAFTTNHIATDPSEYNAYYWFLDPGVGEFATISEEQKQYLLASAYHNSPNYDDRYIYYTDEMTPTLNQLVNGHYEYSDGHGLIETDFWVVVKIGNYWTSMYVAQSVAQNGREIEIY